MGIALEAPFSGIFAAPGLHSGNCDYFSGQATIDQGNQLEAKDYCPVSYRCFCCSARLGGLLSLQNISFSLISSKLLLDANWKAMLGQVQPNALKVANAVAHTLW